MNLITAFWCVTAGIAKFADTNRPL